MTSTLRVHSVSPVIGAEVSGVDLSRPLDDATVEGLEAALAQPLVLFFRDQSLTPERQIAFAERWGKL